MGIGTLKTIASSFYTLVPESFWTHAHHEARRTGPKTEALFI
jgi:hypothetical protein